MIEKVCTFLSEPRFRIADRELGDVITRCWSIFNTIEEIRMASWLYLRRSKNEERRYTADFYGYEKSEQIIRSCHTYRQVNINKRDTEFINSKKQEIEELKLRASKDIEEVKSRNSKTVEKYRFPLRQLIQLVYPDYLRKLYSK
jgi:hypothetical protein